MVSYLVSVIRPAARALHRDLYGPNAGAARREAFNHADWILRIKYDGFRLLARVASGQTEVI
jgi:hypothetical protein